MNPILKTFIILMMIAILPLSFLSLTAYVINAHSTPLLISYAGIICTAIVAIIYKRKY